jgi:hypothetical protein
LNRRYASAFNGRYESVGKTRQKFLVIGIIRNAPSIKFNQVRSKLTV